ncbi:MAG TPA: sialidase family protein, partial [Pyrinomonadaceae bacterium]|nr:sialidase family protein [Pyrinomonadaceae bacterium]
MSGILAVILATTVLFALPHGARAANPTSATLSPTATSPVTWAGTAPGGVTPDPAACVEGVNCETFTLTLGGTPADWTGKIARVRLDWLLPASDYDMFVYKNSVGGTAVGQSAQGTTNFETVDINPAVYGTGNFAVRVIYFAAVTVDQYRGTASVVSLPTTPPPTPSTEPAPEYSIHAAPQGLGQDAGEPTIGANWQTGNAFVIAGLQTLRVKFDDTTKPAKATWTDVSATTTSFTSLDPILFTDSDAGASRTNRTFVSQLAGKASLMAFTDDDGQTWIPSQGSGINSGVDHQTIGGGPYARNANGTLKGGAVQLPGLDGRTYPHAVYYASQDIGLAEIARSDNGGLTFGLAVPMYNLTQCGGLHGHIKVAPDGTVYVPNKGCGENQAVVVSEDNGLTWEVRKVPGSQAGSTDPSLGFGSDGTVYFGYANGDGHARIAVSHDKVRTWEHDQDVGAQLGVRNTVFPAVVGGDPNRAAFFFLGTTTPGSAGIGTDTAFDGTWYAYMATTYDGGKSWVTVNATPNDPVQRGVVCTNGTTCPSGTRNLLDFNDLTMDKLGRPLAVFADGCVTAACRQGVDRNNDNKIDSLDNDGAAVGTIIRQSGGKSLFAAFDSIMTNIPNAPTALAATPSSGDLIGGVALKWTDNSTNE